MTSRGLGSKKVHNRDGGEDCELELDICDLSYMERANRSL